MLTKIGHLKILVVGQETGIGKLARHIKEDGFEVLTIEHESVLPRVRYERPSLILVDLARPIMSGFDICRALKTSTTLRDVPIIIASDKEEHIDCLVALELGADDFISPSTGPKEAILRIHRAILRGL